VIRLRGHVGATRWLWLAAVVVVLDQASKWWVINNFELFQRFELTEWLGMTRLHNTGAAFSILAGAGGWQRWFFVSLGAAVSAGVLMWLRALPRSGQGLLASGLALIVGGALGNVIDRVVHGYVVDFISVHYQQQWFFPAFNVADSAITLGAGLLILDMLFGSHGKEQGDKEKDSKEQHAEKDG
jgi:signal peptidase II